MKLCTLNTGINMENNSRYPIAPLYGYISGLEELRSEIESEISEAKDWIEYL